MTYYVRKHVGRKAMGILILKKTIACCAALCLAITASPVFASPLPGGRQQSGNGQQTQSTAATEPNPATAQATVSQSSAGAAQAGANQQSAPPSKPVGTAVAPYEKTSGVTGSRPAGAVIAPAKQRRIRSIFIKVGIVVGAAAAVGAVVALSHGSPSRPQ